MDSADLNLRHLANVQLLSFWQQVKIIQTEVEYVLEQPAGPDPAPSVPLAALLRFHTERFAVRAGYGLPFILSAILHRRI